MHDIQSREDIILMVNTFYGKVRQHPELGHIFDEVAKVHWETHLPKLYDFWENILFATGAYQGFMMQKHFQVDQKQRLEHDNFVQWLMLFTETVNELFEGPRAEEVKTRALSIAQIMQVKLGIDQGF